MREIEETLAHNLREVREKKGYTLTDVVKSTCYTEVGGINKLHLLLYTGFI